VTVALIIVASALAASVIANALSLRWGMKAKDGDTARALLLADEKTAHGKTTIRAERAEYELAKEKETTSELTRKVGILDKELANERAKHVLGAGLDPGDVDGRLQKLAAEAGGAARGVPAVAGPELSDGQPAATGETIAAAVRNLHPIDELR
jgi:hypothetical protein